MERLFFDAYIDYNLPAKNSLIDLVGIEVVYGIISAISAQ